MSLFYYEYKYLIEPHQLPHAKQMLHSFYGNTDPYPKGWMETVYYDSLDYLCYEECLNGSNHKRKFRTRQYLDSPDLLQVQIKDKLQMEVQKWKLNVPTPERQARSWIDLLADTPKADKLKALSLAYGPLMPAIRIRYHRLRFRNFDCRLNIDENITFEGCNEHPRGLRGYSRLPFAVLEIKTRQERPYLPFMGLLKLPQVSLSKFALGMGVLEQRTTVLKKYE